MRESYHHFKVGGFVTSRDGAISMYKTRMSNLSLALGLLLFLFISCSSSPLSLVSILVKVNLLEEGGGLD